MKVVPVKKVAKIVSGKTPKGVDDKFQEGGEIPFFRVSDMNVEGNEVEMQVANNTVSINDASNLKLRIAQPGTVIFPKRGGAISTNKKRILVKPSAYDLNTMGLTPSENVDKKYFYYWFKSIDLGALSDGSSVPQLNNKQIEPLKIPLPSLTDQKAIVAKLDRAQRLIDIDKEMLAKYDELIQSVFLEMFGDPIANSLDWDMVPFTEIVVLKRGYDLRVKDRVEGKYPIMASSGILDWHNEYKVEGPGVVTGRSGTLGKVHYVNDNYWPLNTALYSKELNGNDPTFILYLLKNFNLDRFSRGAGVPTLNRNLVHKEKIIDVPIELQNSFSEKVSQIEKQKSISKLSLKKSEDLFSSLVQGAFG